MDKAEDSLTSAERLIREGEDRIPRLEELVADMVRRGHYDAARIGRGLLERFQRNLAAFRAALDVRRATPEVRRAERDPDAPT